ncbi:hypothetical protein IAE22_30220 [Bacillus sp. S34]|nr:hypothetical protein [Bacillus sp. S34]
MRLVVAVAESEELTEVHGLADGDEDLRDSFAPGDTVTVKLNSVAYTPAAGLAEGVVAIGEASTGRGLAGIVASSRAAAEHILDS